MPYIFLLLRSTLRIVTAGMVNGPINVCLNHTLLVVTRNGKRTHQCLSQSYAARGYTEWQTDPSMFVSIIRCSWLHGMADGPINVCLNHTLLVVTRNGRRTHQCLSQSYAARGYTEWQTDPSIYAFTKHKKKTQNNSTIVKYKSTPDKANWHTEY